MTRQTGLRDLWDPVTQLLTRALGGNMHFGYWAGTASFDRVSEATDRLTDHVAQRLATSGGARVLDLGCGSGRSAARIASAMDVHVAGVTASVEQYTAAQALAARCAGISFHRYPIDQLRFPADSFDGAFTIDTLLYAADRPGAVSEMARVMRPGGRCIIAEVCLREPLSGRAAVVGAELERTFGLTSIPEVASYREFVRGVGMDVIEIEDIGRQVQPTYAVVAAALRGADGFEAEAAGRLAAAASLVEEFGALPQTSYVLLTAGLPGGDPPVTR